MPGYEIWQRYERLGGKSKKRMKKEEGFFSLVDGPSDFTEVSVVVTKYRSEMYLSINPMEAMEEICWKKLNKIGKFVNR